MCVFFSEILSRATHTKVSDRSRTLNLKTSEAILASSYIMYKLDILINVFYRYCSLFRLSQNIQCSFESSLCQNGLNIH